MRSDEMVEVERRYIADTYGRQPIALVEGRGALVRDSDGKEYIDCFAGLAVLNVGHSHPKVVKAICDQAEKIMHTSNLYYILPQLELAKLLFEVSGGFKSFFCNSGAEANEAAIKLVRKYTGKSEIIAAKNSFHGRTILTLSATGQERYKKGFEPLCREFKHVKFDDVGEIQENITSDTAAIFLEPIQGEGGVVVPKDGYLKEVRKLCDGHDILFVLDEVQTGFGRVGEMFAWQLFDAKPDIFAVAKAMAGGFPMGAMLARPEIMDAFERGDHASTFGGTHIACAAAKASIEALLEENLIERSRDLGRYFMAELVKLKDEYGFIKDVRGKGLMIGMELDFEGSDIVDKVRRKGVLINCTSENVLRFLPPLVIEKEQLRRVVGVLDEVFGGM
ncbi:MAG: aspartate aminotransferase family protein [Candidatus Hydrothermarchaeales archaeon]